MTVATDISDENISIKKKLRIENFANQLLKGRLFIGTFSEQRFVQPLNDYRHVIIVDPSDKILLEDLNVVLRKLKNVVPPDTWIGITTPETIGAPSHYCLWVENDTEKILGSYEYKIKGVVVTDDEVAIKVKSVRNVGFNQSSSETTPNNLTTEDEPPASLHESFELFKNSLLQNLNLFWTEVVTLPNFITLIKTLTVLVIAIFSGFFEFLRVFCDYLLKFLHEFSFLINVSMPLLVAIVKFFEKVFGGILIVTSMIWRDVWGTIWKSNDRNYYHPEGQQRLMYYKN